MKDVLENWIKACSRAVNYPWLFVYSVTLLVFIVVRGGVYLYL